jgi:hypothetical protein
MATQITWIVEAMDCYPQAEGQTDVVFTVHWRCNGTEVDGDKTYNATVYSTQSVTYTAGTLYTPYSDLTEDQVLGWIWAAGVDKNATEAAVEMQIQTQITPTVVSPPLPWQA